MEILIYELMQCLSQHKKTQVVVEFVFSNLEERYPDPKLLQINLTGFLNSKNSRLFLGELWELLVSAQ